jgi:hypothetical protein
MSKEDKLFQPEDVDKQIELLTSVQLQQIPQLSNIRLISDLRQIYVEEYEIVEHVWENLTAQAAQKRQTSADR